MADINLICIILGVIHKCISSEIAVIFRYFLDPLHPTP